METQKYRINRDLTGTTWTIPCSGTTDVWPMNTSTNCSGTTVKNSTCKDIFNYINGNTNDLPEDLKECSPAIPCIILWNCSTPSTYNIPLATNIKCSNLEGYNYVKFTGLRVTYTGIPIQDNFKEVKKVMTIARNNNTTLVPTVPKTDCDCVNPLNDISHKIPIYLSQDFNDIGHYDLWDGNLSQRDLFANFTISGDSSGFVITLTNTMNYSYYDELAPFTYTVDWGHGTPVILPSTTSSISYTYPGVTPQQRTIKLIQDSPWGPMTSSKLITLPLNGYATMFGQAYVPGNASDPGTGIGPNQMNIIGWNGSSSAYHGRYPDFPLDSATDIDQFSGMSYTGLDCYTVTGVTESVLGNFQSYTNNSDPNLPAGYLEGVWVPIGGDVISPLNNTFQTGMYGVITTATTTYTAYTVSSSFGATTNNADGDTPITFYDMSNGITIFEADSCGLDKRAFGALECIDCPEDDCEWCENKDEYYDRVDGVNIPLPPINNRQTWIPHPVVDYTIGDMVYDETWNSCCCFIAVKDITSSDAWYGKPPSISNEGKFLDDNDNEVHVWEACSYDCVSCGLGTQTPCNDNTNPNYTGEVYGVNTITFTTGQFAEDEHGNCYEALNTGSLAHPTGSTVDWDYIGCVSWICPTDPAGTDCIMINGPQQGGVYGELRYADCLANLNSPNGCFPLKYACPNLYDCVGCIQIDATHALYTTSSAFNLMADCVVYCNPPAWSCATPTSSNCCFELDCNNTYSLYMSSVGTNLIPGSSTTPATNGQLTSFKNTYDIYVEGGTAPADYDEDSCTEGCCVNTSWAWSCGEEACNLVGGPPNGINAFSTSAECETYTLTYSQYSGQNATNLEDIICGWTCVTQNVECVYEPCVPCFYASCGVDEVACNMICSANTECGCWRCSCEGGVGSMGPDCTFYLPCVAPSGETWVSYVDGYAPPSPPSGIPGPNPAYNTYTTESACLESCECDFGWDCFLNATGGTIGMCQGGLSLAAMAALEYSPSDPTAGFTGYTTFEECCDNTGCCYAQCAEGETLTPEQATYYNAFGAILSLSTPNSPYGLTTTFPCIWDITSNQSSGVAQPCNDPAVPGWFYWPPDPWCTLDLCVQYALTITSDGSQVCTDPPGKCDCACGSHIDFSASTGGWNGSTVGYNIGDAVSWSDADTNYCCFMCVCPNTNTDWTVMANVTYAIAMGQSAMDCDIMEPDLDPSAQGLGSVTNCWESCLKQPVQNPSPADGPDACEDCEESETYYECTDSGCTQSTCTNPALSFCYTSSTCDDMCNSSCFCNGWANQGAPCTDTCIMQETVMLNPILFNLINTCGPFSYTQGTMDNCTTNLISGALDCCGDTEEWYCDNSVACSGLNLLPISSNIGNGVGCVRVYPGDTQYGDPSNFANQIACQKECRWKCDPNGFATCEFITTYPVSLIGTYPSAFMCYLSTIDCDCTNAVTEWWCYDDQDPFSTNGGCISNISGLNSTQQQGLWGQGQVAYTTNPNVAFTSLSSCEDQCRFCCDESGNNGGFCEHKWGGIGCCQGCGHHPTELDCMINNTPYPCYSATTQYWCDTIMGCTQTPTSVAVGSTGPWPNLSLCEAECAFDCNEDCACEVTLTPNYTSTNPMNAYGAPWPMIADCITAVAKDPCCPCESCTTNSPIGIHHYDQNTSLWGWTYITPVYSNPVQVWAPGTYSPTGQQGEVVMHEGCCFVVTDTHFAGWLTLSPTADYNNYITNYNSSNSADWPSLLSNWGNPIIYFPCDPDCVKLTGSSKSWYCDANITTNTSNCVPDTGAWTPGSAYANNVFGQGQTTYTNNQSNGFASEFDCRNYCRFCCKEVVGGPCKICCRKKHHGPKDDFMVEANSAVVLNVAANNALYYWITTDPCECNPGDVQVPNHHCDKIILNPDNPWPDEPMESYSYLETYDNRMGNPGNQYNILLKQYEQIMENCGSYSRTNNVGDCPDDIEIENMQLKLEQLLKNTNSGPQYGCTDPLAINYVPSATIDDGSCIYGSSTWACELNWGNNDCLTTMYSCQTLTAPCGDDPCEICLVTGMQFTICDHTGSYNAGLSVQGWHINVPSYNGMWTPGLTTTAYSNLYVTDPIDNCCYFNGTDYVYLSQTPVGAWLVEPSVCYANHLQGLFCDGSVNYPGNPLWDTQQQNIFPLWWPCDTSCPVASACTHCDANTPIWDASTTYNAGDLVLWTCTDPVVLVPNTLGSGAVLYCCFQACTNPGVNCQAVPAVGVAPGSMNCEYWTMICGCDDGCPSPDCDPAVVPTAWQCLPGGCYLIPGTSPYSDEDDCLDACNEFMCSDDSYFTGQVKCSTNDSNLVLTYIDAGGTTINVDSKESFINAFINGNITFGNGTNSAASTWNLDPINYTYVNTQTQPFTGMHQGCPVTNPITNANGFRCTVDGGCISIAFAGFQGHFFQNWQDAWTYLANNFNININACTDLDCARNIILNPTDPLNGASVLFTQFEASYRPCLCGDSSLDCQCLLIPGTGTTNAYNINNYTGCLDDCCQGLCSDCVTNLAYCGHTLSTDVLIHRGIQSYYGNDTFGYNLLDCVTNPVDDCCVCCVDNQLGNTVPDTHGGHTADCHLDVISTTPNSTGGVTHGITFYDGTNSGTGRWVWCGVMEDNTAGTCPTGPVF